jgi:amidase
VAKAEDPKNGYKSPWKAASMKRSLQNAGDINDPVFKVSINEAFTVTRAYVLAVMEKYQLDAIIYPTSPQPAREIGAGTFGDTPGGGGGGTSPSGIANQTGFPDLIVPAGMTKDGLPVTLSFLGPAFSEPKLLAYGYDFEQATHARVLPKTTPKLTASVAATQ